MEQSSDRVIHVSNLPKGITVDFLKTLFKECGEVVSVTIKERPQGIFAFIAFDTPEACLTAIKEFNYTKLNGIPIVITPTTQEYQNLIKSGEGNLYVKGLDEYIEISHLHELFQQYGEVISCKLPMTPDGKNKGYAYVQFKDPANAEKARAELNDVSINGKRITVEPYQKKSHPLKTNAFGSSPAYGSAQNDETFTNIFIRNLPDNIKTNTDLGNMFSEFGMVLSTKLLPDGQSGFCNMIDHDSAIRAIQALNGKVINGKVIEATRAKGKEERMGMMAGARTSNYRTPPTFTPGFGTTAYSSQSSFQQNYSSSSVQNQSAFGPSSTISSSTSIPQTPSTTTYSLNPGSALVSSKPPSTPVTPAPTAPSPPSSGGGFAKPPSAPTSTSTPGNLSSSPFGQPAFGASKSVFGASSTASTATNSSSSAFSTPAFGASTSIYGAPMYGNTNYGSAFGAPKATATTPSSTYGQPYGAPVFGASTSSSSSSQYGSSLYGTPYGLPQQTYGLSGSAFGTSSSPYGTPQAQATVFGSATPKYGSAFGSGLPTYGSQTPKAQVFSASGQNNN